MKFYDRERELKILRDMMQKSKTASKMTVVTGRRRIGKTTLLLKAFEDESMLYFFVGRKSEKDLCLSFCEEIKTKFHLPLIGEINSFAQIFEYLMQISMERAFTLVIDEFQEFIKVNPSIFADIQRIWDLYKDRTCMNLVVSGSIYRMMNKIFKDRSEPLYGRQDKFLMIRPFMPSVLKQILSDFNPQYTSDDLLALYSITGGVAKYVQLLMESGATDKESILKAVSEPDSFFIDEGQYLLIDEFSADYGVYFSILAAIASGYTKRKEIEDVVGKEVGGYITRLEHDYEIVSKVQPIWDRSSQSKKVRYKISDNFLTFWFRFVYKYNYMIEIQSFQQFHNIIVRDYEVFTGHMLERYFRDKLIETQQYTQISSWWDRRGENEIDIVAENELNSTIDFFEIKRNEKKYNEEVLRKKIDAFVDSVHLSSKYKISYGLLSLDNM